MTALKKWLGMESQSPVARTFVQAALPILVAAGTDFVHVAVWKSAVLAGVAAVFAFGQAKLRSDG